MNVDQAETIIKQEIQKSDSCQDKAKILKAQRVTFRKRREAIGGLTDNSVSTIIAKYPFLKKAEYVSFTGYQ